MKSQRITLQNFETLNLGHPSEIKPNEWADTQNMVRASDGLWENRKGITSFENAVGSSLPVHSLHFWKPSAGGSRYLTVGSGAALYSYAESTAYNNGSFTSRQTGFSSGEPFSFAQYADMLLCANGREYMHTTTNNTTFIERATADSKIAKYVLFANDTGYCADVHSIERAYLTGDTGAEAVFGNWAAVTDGEFAITIDGTAYDITGIDFTGVADMDAVAAKIQAAIRAATGSTETCVWSTNKFIITSASSELTSEVSVTSTVSGGTGTDISGAGGSDWMDCDTGNGTATAITGDRSTIYYGATVPANPFEFANSVDIESDNGQVITGLSNLGGYALSTKDASIYSVDIATPSRDQLDYGAGCVSHRSIVKALNDVYLGSDEGIFTVAQRSGTTGSFAATPISDPIQPLWDILSNKDQIAGVYYAPARSIFWGVQTSTQRYVLVYNVQHKAWSYFIGANVRDWTIYEDEDGDKHLLYGDSGVDKVRELLVERADDDAPINSLLLTGSINFGTDELKTINWLEIAGYASDGFKIDSEIYFDEEDVASSTTTIDDDNFQAGTATSGGSLASGSLASTGLSGYIASNSDVEVKYWVKRIPLERTFQTIRVKLTNSQAGIRWRFKSIVMDVESTAKDFVPDYKYN